MNSLREHRKFVVATPARSVCDDHARALQTEELLRFIALGTRRGTAGIPSERTRLNPWIGLAAYAAARTMSSFHGESFRFRLLPWFDRWVKRQLQAGDHIISSYGYANECFKWVRQHGGNSHPANFWEILSEEHARWQSPYPPVTRHWIDRSLAMMEHVDYVLSPSTYVTESFIARGFRSEQILRSVYPVNLDCFMPAKEPRPRSRPLTLISTGMLSLRKGTPYLLEAFRIVRKEIPDARLLLTRQIQDNVKPVLKKYSDLPIDWSPTLPHHQLAERLRSGDIFVLSSLEDGFARTLTEALACGLPAITTLNTGASDFIVPGVNGEIVPIRDARAIAEAILLWRDKVLSPTWERRPLLDTRMFSFESFAQVFLQQLKTISLA
jgi:glycosyltransferase involved in cell wall biosynthesis